MRILAKGIPYLATLLLAIILSSATVYADDGKTDAVGGETSFTLANSHTVVTQTGDYQAAGCGLRGTSTCTITISGIPLTATITSATLYWAILGVGAAGCQGCGIASFDGTPMISVAAIGFDTDPCWPGFDTTFAFRADVTAMVNGNGVFTLTGMGGTAVPFLNEGASLVVIYSDPAEPLRNIILDDGVDTVDGPVASVSHTISGFIASTVPVYKTTYIVGDGQSFSDFTDFNGVNVGINDFSGSDGAFWDTITHTSAAALAGLVSPGDVSATVTVRRPAVGLGDCMVHVAQIFSITIAPPIVDARVPEFGLEAVLMIAILAPLMLLLVRRSKGQS